MMKTPKEITLKEIAEMVGGRLSGDGSVIIKSVASLEQADKEAMSFLGNPKFKEQAEKCGAGALIVKEALDADLPQVIVSDPYTAFVKLMEHFHPEERPVPGVHPAAVVEEGVELGDGVCIGPLAAVGEGSSIGAGSVISAGCVIGKGCEVGSGCLLHSRVTLYPGTRVGDNVIIHSGTVIGSDGFGFILSESGHVKKPQKGSVVIEDDVEIGANCAIDRAMLDSTVIGEGTKLDNLVHLAHNVRVGKHCIILAGTGVGGSARIGDFCVISGHVSIKDNVTLGDRAQVAGRSVITDDVAAGQTVWGFPAMPFSHAKRVYARIKQLPDLFKRVRTIEKTIRSKDK
jgi:UDP-3-O-[3-hydroxymyristoyl] glucosamine N-acyltransferase